MIKSYKFQRMLVNAAIYILLIIMSVIWLFPIFWLVMQSFGEGIKTASHIIPKTLSFDNYIGLFTNQYMTVNGWEKSAFNFTSNVLNTLLVAIATCLISTVLVLLTSFAFSRLRFKARQPMMKAILVMGMFPGFLGMIILYWMLNAMGLTGSLFGLVLAYSAGAGMGYYVSKGFFDTISKSIDEAAIVDGCSRFQVFTHITLPLSKPIIIYTILTSFMGPWGDFITSSYLMTGQDLEKQTVAVILNTMINNQEYAAEYYGQFFAGAVCIGIPITLLFIFMQKYYVSGVTGGAVKG